MKKKIVVLGGGTGMSNLLRSLKHYPVDISAIVVVSDNGSSTGILREEFNIPAVGDIRRVLVSLSETEPLITKLFNYRFETTSDLNGHTVGNLLLTASSEITGNLSDGVEALSKILNLKGKVIPLTEDNVTLMGEMEDGNFVEGEVQITLDKRKIKRILYKEEPKATEEAINAIREADLIVFSMGSLFTSIIPNLICDNIAEEICKSKAKIMYVCNIMTQKGETDNFTASDHVKMINSYLKDREIDAVLVNNGIIDNDIEIKYKNSDQSLVRFDKENFKDLKAQIIEDNFLTISNNFIRHNVNKLGLQIFIYLMQL